MDSLPHNNKINLFDHWAQMKLIITLKSTLIMFRHLKSIKRQNKKKLIRSKLMEMLLRKRISDLLDLELKE